MLQWFGPVAPRVAASAASTCDIEVVLTGDVLTLRTVESEHSRWLAIFDPFPVEFFGLLIRRCVLNVKRLVVHLSIYEISGLVAKCRRSDQIPSQHAKRIINFA